jgi:type II secretory pathway component GspD/PulD (secretin)
MTISVHEPSNSLIVVAPEPLYRKVQLLVDTLDEAGTELNQVMEVLQIKDADPKLVSDALAPFFGTSGGAKSSTPAAGSSPATTSQDIQRRQEFIQRMFGGQRGGATGGSRGGATGGSSRGGGRPGGR